MAPIDFEKELQERLRSREVKPRPEAWDQISARLEEEGPAPSGKPWGWMGLVAASVAMLLGFLFLWEPVGEPPAIDSVVESPEIEVPEKAGVQPMEELITNPSANDEAIVAGQTVEPDVGEEPDGVTSAVAQYEKRKEVALSSEPVDTNVDEILPETGSVNKAGTAVVFEGTSSEVSMEQVKADEIDALLQQAQESIALQKDKDTLSAIDAMTLLDRAEDELDQTFREKIMTKIKTGVTKLRTAVADRRK